MVISLNDMKNYLRVDFEEDDRLISDLIEESQQMCMDIARIEDEDVFDELLMGRIAVMYAVAYLYEHREEADHKKLTLSLRSMLFGVRREAF